MADGQGSFGLGRGGSWISSGMDVPGERELSRLAYLEPNEGI